MIRSTYRCIAALTLSALMAFTVVVATEDSHHSTPVVEGHWCC
jgi:hypothetical protein